MKNSKNLLDEIKKISKDLKHINIMEVCGTHTMAISRFGIRKSLPENINLISGPGCPVCVTPIEEVDKAIELSNIDNVIITTFGDMLKVPGTKTTLYKQKSKGKDIRVVYSPYDALKIAEENKKKDVVFLGVGFETTSPTIAVTLKIVKTKKIKNFYVLPEFKLVIPALFALSEDKELNIDGFLAPGHVSTIIGWNAYKEVTDKYKMPCVVSGFDEVDILESILMILKQIKNKVGKVENQYVRSVKKYGNKLAQKLLKEVYKVVDSNWRGIGVIPLSGYTLSDKYREYNILTKYNIDISYSKEPKGCRCGDVLKGKIKPDKCPLFAKRCTPENPVGACMVSFEGSCAAYYKYERF